MFFNKYINFLIFFFSFCLIQNGTIAFACPDIDGLADLNCDQKLRILAFGDSITKGEQDELGLGVGYIGRLKLSFFPNAQVYNLGHSGENTSSGRRRASRYFPRYDDIDYAIVLEGVNDFFASSHSSSKTKSNLLNILKSGKNNGFTTLLGKLSQVNRSSSPRQQNWVSSVNGRIRPYASIDFYSLGKSILSKDKLHPNGAGYQKMAELASIAIEQKSEQYRPADSDHDGVYDFAERNKFNTNPNVADTDNDGVSDGDEIFTYNSNPNSADSDGDGISDYTEIVVYHSDPANPLPKPPTVTGIEAL